MPPRKKNDAVKPKVKGKQKAYQLADLDATGLLLTDIFKKEWRVGCAVGTGGFGRLYQATDESNGTGSDYVMKIEPKENGPLFAELSFYQRVAKKEMVEEFRASRKLKSLGMPVFITKGLYDDKYRFMVIPRYQTDLQKIFNDCNKSFPAKTVITVALQTLDVLEYLHINKYVHADIKAANLLLGLKDANQVYLVDYGLATMYKNSDGVHNPYKPDPKKAHDGTIEFTSRDAHDGCAPSRRADLEILGYCCLQWLNSQLPWETCLSQHEKVADQKRKFMGDPARSVSTLSADIPKCLVDYLVYVAGLDYDEEPGYAHIRTTFKNGMKKDGIRLDGKLDFPVRAGPSLKRKSTGKTPTPKKPAKGKPVVKATTKRKTAAKKSAANGKAKPEKSVEDLLSDESDTESITVPPVNKNNSNKRKSLDPRAMKVLKKAKTISTKEAGKRKAVKPRLPVKERRALTTSQLNSISPQSAAALRKAKANPDKATPKKSPRVSKLMATISTQTSPSLAGLKGRRKQRKQ